MCANGLLVSAKPGHIESSDQSAVRRTDANEAVCEEVCCACGLMFSCRCWCRDDAADQRVPATEHECSHSFIVDGGDLDEPAKHPPASHDRL